MYRSTCQNNRDAVTNIAHSTNNEIQLSPNLLIVERLAASHLFRFCLAWAFSPNIARSQFLLFSMWSTWSVTRFQLLHNVGMLTESAQFLFFFLLTTCLLVRYVWLFFKIFFCISVPAWEFSILSKSHCMQDHYQFHYTNYKVWLADSQSLSATYLVKVYTFFIFRVPTLTFWWHITNCDWLVDAARAVTVAVEVLRFSYSRNV